MRALSFLACVLLVVATSANARVTHQHSVHVTPHRAPLVHNIVSRVRIPATDPTPTVGKASWYGLHDGSGRVTAEGKRFDPYALGLAHSTWRFGSKVRITNLQNGKVVVATVMDRNGPGVAGNGRKFDLYYGTAVRLDMVHSGEALVRVEPLDNAEGAEEGLARVVRAHWAGKHL